VTTGMYMRLLLHICSRMYMHTGAYVTLHSSAQDEDEHDMKREEAACSFVPANTVMRDEHDNNMKSVNIIDVTDNIRRSTKA